MPIRVGYSNHSKTGYNALGYYSETSRWTPLAKQCYARGCICNGCHYSKFFTEKRHCGVKACVLELVRVFGKPNLTQVK